MNKHPVPNPRFIPDVIYKVGEKCLYWLKFGEYAQQQAMADNLLDAQGNLTQLGLGIIMAEQEAAKQRGALLRGPKVKQLTLQNKIKARGPDRLTPLVPDSHPLKLKISSAHRTRKKIKSLFIKEVKTLLAKVDGRFVHFTMDKETCLLVVRTPGVKGGTTSHTFRGSIPEIKQELIAFLEGIETNSR